MTAVGVGLAAGFGAGMRFGIGPTEAGVGADVPLPLMVQRVRQLASLATVEATVVDVHVTRLRGRAGAVRVVLLVKGDVRLVCDVDRARFDVLDPVAKTAVVVLPPPVASRPRVDHEASRVYSIDREGLWRIVPGSTGEPQVLTAALREAQCLVADAVDQEDLCAAARRRAEALVERFCGAVGWSVRVEWDQPAP